ncbi:MAG: bifunctional phosphoribosylaminoimidazolecarboxamide formyltransferase/IMP cyclohydrolase [Pseudomonadota bacterium]
MADQVAIKRALLSVSDKTGLSDLGHALAAAGVEIVSTGGTARALRDAGVTVRDVSDLTGMAEIMDGRVKTLHPGVHGGLLALRDNPGHQAVMETHGISPIDLAVINLYPFEATVAAGAAPADVIEMIDIGGPAMIRAAAKNHAHVAVVVDPTDYTPLMDALWAGGTDLALRRRLAQAAYAHTAAYDTAVSAWMAGQLGQRNPPQRTWAATLAGELRYGENPHQAAAFYRDGSGRPGVATATQHQGKALSYNNINDTDAAFELVAEFDPADGPAVAIIKHANPSGLATGATFEVAYRRAFDCDRTSAYGGIVALNGRLDRETALAITEIFTEVVIAPEVDPDAVEVFAAKPNLRLLTTGAVPDARAPGTTLRQVAGGILVQDRDAGHVTGVDWQVVTKRAPTKAEAADMAIAWRVAKHVKSNAIVYARGGGTVGIGAGQMSRVDSARIAARKAQDMAEACGLTHIPTQGSAVASDAFFPFADGLLSAAQAGATAVIQPGGSIRDADIIAAADEAGLAMVFTGMRHFRH